MNGPPVVAIIGGGASGTLSAAHLIAAASRAERSLQVLVIDPGAVGQGIAYSTLDRRHRLNVVASRMSAWPDQPEHFLNWLRANGEPGVSGSTYAARIDYGRYLASVLDATVSSAPGVGFGCLQDRVTGLTRHGRRLRLRLADSGSRAVDGVVLAIGGGRPAIDWAPAELSRSDRFVADPWAPGALEQLPAGDVVLVGSGLTMADVALKLGQPGRRLHVISRHGLLPLAHAEPTPTPPPSSLSSPDVPPGPLALSELRRFVFEHIRSSMAGGAGWIPAVDSLRPVTQQLWSQLAEPDRAAFRRSAARRWDRVRHRVEPGAGQWLAGQLARGQLQSHAAEIVGAHIGPGSIAVRLSNGRSVDAAVVINCTGPSGDLRGNDDALVLDVLASGLAQPGPAGLGIATDATGRLIPAQGVASAIWTLGPPRKGQLWESTAVAEIRTQAAALAPVILAQLPSSRLRRRPRDGYGLPLSANLEAAGHFNAAMGRILRVQSGAEQLLRDAVAADPNFAVGHASLALLGAEWGAELDVVEALATAQRTAVRADERERRFIEVATER